MARVNLNKGMLAVGYENVYYCDTDSIMTSEDLPSNMVGKELGQWKLEHNLEEGIFIAPKIYYIKTSEPNKDGKYETMKCKGIRNSLLDL